MESPRVTQKAQTTAADNSPQNNGQMRVEQSSGSLTRTRSSSNLVEGHEEILFNRQLVIPEADLKNSYCDFFLEIYSVFLQSPYEFQGLAKRIFYGSQQAQKLFYRNNYFEKLLNEVVCSKKAEVNSNILELLDSLLDKIEFSLEIQLKLRDSLIEILNLSCPYINSIRVRDRLLVALKKLAKIQKDDPVFYTICWDAIAKNINDSNSFTQVATTLVEIDNDGTKSFPIIVKFLEATNTAIDYKAAELLGIIASKENVNNLIYTQCLTELKNINSYQQFFYGFQAAKLKVFQDPEQIVVFLNEILNAIKKFIPWKRHHAHHTESLLKDYIKILTEFPNVDCLTIEIVVDTLINQIQEIREKENDFHLQLRHISLIGNVFTLTHKYRFYPSIRKRALDFMFETLHCQNKECHATAAQYFSEIVCAPECCNKQYLEEAFNMMEDKRSGIRYEAIQIIGYYRIHTELSDDEKERCLRALKKATLEFDNEEIARRAICFLQKLIQKPNELEEVTMRCYSDIVVVTMRHYYAGENDVKKCAINVLSELAAEISAWKNECWKACIMTILNNLNKAYAVEALGRFAMLCKGNQEIVTACYNAIAKSNLQVKKDQSSIFSGLGMLMRSPGISEEQIRECIRQIEDIINSTEIKFDPFSTLICELKETAQFWHKNITITNIIIDCLKRLLWNKELSQKDFVIVKLHSLTQVPGIEDSLKKACYMTLLEGLAIYSIHSGAIHNRIQSAMEDSLANNSVSPEIIKIYLEHCIHNLTKSSYSAHIGFANICLFYERHPEHLTSDVIRLLEKGKNRF